MGQQPTFVQLLQRYVARDGRHARQLSAETARRYGAAQALSNTTLSRWLRGDAKKPRSWADIVKLSAVLRLSQEEMYELLHLAGFIVPELLAVPPPLPGLFDQWQVPAPEKLPPFQAPPALPHFVGRAEQLQALKRYLGSQGQSRVCCLLGMAGLGKTSLAAQLAYPLKARFPDGLLWLRLDQTDPASALQAIAKTYNEDLTHHPDLGTRSSKVRELLASKNALLVLDQAQDDGQIRPLLPPDGACAVLITSQKHDLATTAAAFRLILPTFDPEKGESLTLFRHVLGKTAVQAEEDALQQIADGVGHLPLAIQIVGQRLKHEPGWTAAQMLTRLQQAEQPLDLLVFGDQSVRRRFAESLQNVSAEDQALFALLSRFPGSFLPAPVAYIGERPLAEVEDGLRRLYARSLLLVTPEGRYSLHSLLRAFSREQPQQTAWAPRFVEYFAGLAAKPDAASEQASIVAAITLANDLQMDETVVTAVTHLYPHLQRTGQLEASRALLTLAEQSARSHNNLTGLTRVLHQSGFTAMKQGQPQAADGYYQEALTLAKQTGDTGQTAEILHKLSALAYRRGRLEEAQQFCQEALALARTVDDQALIASLLTNLGLAEAASGRLPEAISHYEEALALARRLDDSGLIINILQNLGHVHEQRGDYAQARAQYEEGLILAEAQKDPELRSRMLGNLGAVACHLGNYAEAAGHFRRGLALAEANGLIVQQYRQQANLGEAATLRGQYRQANAHYRQALALVRDCNFPEDLGIILNQAGESYLKQDEFQEAASLFNESMALAKEKGLPRVEPFGLLGLARVAAARGNMTEARRLGEQSREQLLAIGHRKAGEVWWWLQELPRTTAPD